MAMRGFVGDVGNMPEATSRTGRDVQAHILKLWVSWSLGLNYVSVDEV